MRRIRQLCAAIRRRPGGVALLVSALLHLSLFAWWRTRPEAVAPLPAPAAKRQVEVAIVHLPETKAPAEPPARAPRAPSPAGVSQRPPRAADERHEPRAPAAVVRPPEAPAAAASAAQASPEAAGLQAPPVDSSEVDVPLAPPTLELSPGGIPVPGGRLTGKTVVNDGVDHAHTPQALRAEAAEAEALVQGWIDDTLAERRAQTGAVDVYFHDLRAALEEKAAFKLPLAVDVKRELEQSVASYLSAAEAFGRTGNPGLDVSDAALEPVPVDDDRNGISRAREQLAAQTSGIRKAIEGAYGTEPVAIVELRQAPDGTLREAILLRGSGNPVFDREVMASVPVGVAAAPVMPDRVRAAHPKELRTVWAFRGKFILRKKLRDLKVRSPKDAAYLAAMSALSVFSGAPFEETTMDVYVFDLADPGFEVKAKLLRQY